MADTAVNIKDAANATVSVDATAVTTTPTAIAAGQSARQNIAVYDAADNLIGARVLADANGANALRVLPSSAGRLGDVLVPALSSTGTQIGTVTAIDKGISIQVPPGASIALYVAAAALGTAAAAAAISRQYTNPTSATSPIEVQINLANSMQVFGTNATSGTATTFATGACTYRVI